MSHRPLVSLLRGAYKVIRLDIGIPEDLPVALRYLVAVCGHRNSMNLRRLLDLGAVLVRSRAEAHLVTHLWMSQSLVATMGIGYHRRVQVANVRGY